MVKEGLPFPGAAPAHPQPRTHAHACRARAHARTCANRSPEFCLLPPPLCVLARYTCKTTARQVSVNIVNATVLARHVSTTWQDGFYHELQKIEKMGSPVPWDSRSLDYLGLITTTFPHCRRSLPFLHLPLLFCHAEASFCSRERERETQIECKWTAVNPC